MQLQRRKACCVLLARLGHERAHSGVSRPTCFFILALPFPCSMILLHSLMSFEPLFPYLQPGITRRRSESWSLLQELRELIDELPRSRLYPQRAGHISEGAYIWEQDNNWQVEERRMSPAGGTNWKGFSCSMIPPPHSPRFMGLQKVHI